jgi:hypothetical protein
MKPFHRVTESMARHYWLMKRVYSERAHHHKGYMPYVWKVIKEFPIQNIPTSKMGFSNLVKRIARQFGFGYFMILREQFTNEKSHFRLVVQFQVRPDLKWRFTKRATQNKANKAEPDSFFKQPQKRLLVTTDAHELLRNRKRNMLKALETRVQKPKLYTHTIRSSVSNRPWKMTITTQTRR